MRTSTHTNITPRISLPKSSKRRVLCLLWAGEGGPRNKSLLTYARSTLRTFTTDTRAKLWALRLLFVAAVAAVFGSGRLSPSSPSVKRFLRWRREGSVYANEFPTSRRRVASIFCFGRIPIYSPQQRRDNNNLCFLDIDSASSSSVATTHLQTTAALGQKANLQSEATKKQLLFHPSSVHRNCVLRLWRKNHRGLLARRRISPTCEHSFDKIRRLGTEVTSWQWRHVEFWEEGCASSSLPDIERNSIWGSISLTRGARFLGSYSILKELHLKIILSE